MGHYLSLWAYRQPLTHTPWSSILGFFGFIATRSVLQWWEDYCESYF